MKPENQRTLGEHDKGQLRFDQFNTAFLFWLFGGLDHLLIYLFIVI